MKIKTTRHAVYQIAYHLVWVTKYRRSIITQPMQERLKAMLNQIALAHGFEIIAVEAEPEHVHCFVSAPPKIAPATIVKILKGTSARWMFREFSSLKVSLSNGHLWHPSTYIGTAGNVSAETIKKYINQQWERG